MKQIQFEFMDTTKAEARELLRQIREKSPDNTISLAELIGYVREYGERGEEIYCSGNGMLFCRKRGTG